MCETDQCLKSKIPGPDTGIEIKHSICDICTPGAHCGLDVYVKDGAILKVEGTEGFPGSDGKLCTKGACSRQYVYREGRIKTPLHRVGPRGSGSFEPISWEEAYREIAGTLNRIKKEDGPEAVAWYTGYSKWYRPWLHRLVHSFGSENYGTESSSCFKATQMAWTTVTGRNYRPDLRNANTYLGWGSNVLINWHIMGKELTAFKARGGKVIIIDPRETPTSTKLADIHLRLRPGTDGALALGLCHLVIENGWLDRDYVDRYVYGFEEFRAYAARFTPEYTQEVTGVPKELLYAAAKLYATNGPAAAYSPSATLTHHINGYNNFRAVIALQVLCGNIDRKGGMLPIHTSLVYTDCGFDTKEHSFVTDTAPQHCKERIGDARFPVWAALSDEFQAMDLTRQIEEGTPYPIKALVGFGMNHRMFPQPKRLLSALDKLELVVCVDLVMTDMSAYADILLPACSSLERSELKGYPGGLLTCTEPAISPLYSSKPDPQIICELASYLDLNDPLLKSGYENTMRYLISDLSVTLEELKAAPLPIRVKEFKPYRPGTYLERGFETRSGKLELFSLLIDALHRPGLDPLPTYTDSFDSSDPARFPLTLITGARLPNAIHSRLHDVPWVRSLRPEPAADLNPGDAAGLGLQEGDGICLSTSAGSVHVKAHLTEAVSPGEVYLYHGYREADANELIPADHLDPYSGFPGFRQTRCAVTKEERTERRQ